MTSSASWLTTEDLAARMKVPVRTVHRWNTDGTGPRRYRFGRSVRYKLADVEAWEAEHAVDQPQPVPVAVYGSGRTRQRRSRTT